MTKDQKRIKIAEFCGWRVIPPSANYQGEIVLNPHGNQQPSRRWLPDYFKDLNAMHEAEKTIPTAEMKRRVAEILDDGNGGHFASAAQRADAFGVTLGLWTESEVER